MTRWALLAVLVGCGTPAAHHDAGVDSGQADAHRYLDSRAYDGSAAVMPDACVIYETTCGPLHIVVNGVCEAFCSETTYPRCPSGFVEYHQSVCGADICTCAAM